MEWNNGASLALIEEYKNQLVLWNSRHGYHYSKVRKQEAWETIAYNMQLGVDEVRQKMNSLLGSFRRERSKMRRGVGKYASGNYSSQWFAFDKMLFLLERNEDVSDDKIYLEQFQVKLEGAEDDNLTLDSDSNHLLEEELNEASQDVPPETGKHGEKRSTTPTKSSLSKKTKLKNYSDPTAESTSSSLHTQDECIMYGQYIARKLMQMNSKTRSLVEHAIGNVLFEASMGKYDDVPSPFDAKQETPTTTFFNSHLDGINLFSSACESPKHGQLSLAAEVSEAVTSDV